MQRYLVSLSASLPVMAFLLCAGPALAQLKAKAENVPEIPYESVPDFLKLPAGEYLGESVGVATNSKGHTFVYHRSATTRLFEFDQNGNFLKEIGKGTTVSSSPIRCASMPRTISGPSTRAPTW